MATLTISINSPLGTSTKVLTFAGPDAQRMLNAFQNQVPGGTQQQLADQLAGMLKDYLGNIVIRNESTFPVAPVMT